MLELFHSTIAAISTPKGKGGIAVIRMSGPDAIMIGERFLHPANGSPLRTIDANRAILTKITDAEEKILDEGIVVLYRAPRSYTGEDTVEISCHGGILLTEEVLSRAFACGAMPAGPGEFTRRAFSAGKLSLSEAEAVIGMIDAETSAALTLSKKNLDGSIRRKTDALYEKLRDIVSSVYASIDFPDEDLAVLGQAEIRSRMEETARELATLAHSYHTGHAVCEGIRTVIFGKPNTGKSTILNLLAGKERAIVTDVPGTTRDVVEESVCAGAVLLRLSDTAGVRETDDKVESIGVDRSIAALNAAELILAVFDQSRPFSEEDQRILSLTSEKKEAGIPVIPILNKADLSEGGNFSVVENRLGTPIRLCAKEEKSRAALTKIIEAQFLCGNISGTDDTIITNARQFAAVSAAEAHVKEALSALDSLGEDTACAELERAMGKLGELDGREVGIDVVDSIFHRFCVGK